MDTWDPDQYQRFGEERGRPFRDLLSRVPPIPARAIADLGCGTGELTRSLAERWPAARIVGVDRSTEMLSKARDDGRVRFVRADLESWGGPGQWDLVVSNAALHWVDGHEALLPRLAGLLTPGGVLAVQMPDNAGEPSHRALAACAEDPRWADRLRGAGPPGAKTLDWYVEKLLDHGLRLDAWRTTYHHVLAGEDAVLSWLLGTAARPYLARLGPEEQALFLDALRARLRAAYPQRSSPGAGPERWTVFPFHRVFFVARARTGP
jgi:trans-aconitate 2-methyltransferase